MADKVLIKAQDLAREAAAEAADGAEFVGAHLSATEVDERLVTHQFACEMPGYRGWVWEVVVARAPRGKEAAVCEAHLVPADDALLAPAWVPWAERIQPGDLDAHMVLPLVANDPRLVPGYEQTEDQDADAVAIWEFGLGRERVLGPEGRDDASERWYRGSSGPTAASAIASTAQCVSCAFLIPLAGSMRGAFGVCANEWSASDASVVSADHGCGAHSQTDLEKQPSRWPADQPVVDTFVADQVDVNEADPEIDAEGSEPVSTTDYSHASVAAKYAARLTTDAAEEPPAE